MHCIFLASVSDIHFAIIGNAVLYFVAGLEAVVVAFFLGVVCSLLYYFVAVMLVASLRVVVVERIALLRGALLRDAPLLGILPFGVLLLELLLV